MPDEYTPAASYHGTITYPRDGELATAGSLVGIQQVADNAAAVAAQVVGLNAGSIARKDLDNNFSVGQHINGLVTCSQVQSGDVNCGALGAAGVTCSGAMTVTGGNSLTVGKDITSNTGNLTLSGASAYVRASEYRHGVTPPTRTTAINLGLGCQPGGAGSPVAAWFRDDTSGIWTCNVANARLYFPVRLPKGAVLTKIEVQHAVASGSATIAFLQRTPQWGSTGVPSVASGSFGASSSSPPSLGVSSWTGSVTINNDTTEYEVRIFSAAFMTVAAVRCTWTDPGPRNE